MLRSSKSDAAVPAGEAKERRNHSQQRRAEVAVTATSQWSAAYQRIALIRFSASVFQSSLIKCKNSLHDAKRIGGCKVSD
jgi:hypothetical protein